MARFVPPKGGNHLTGIEAMSMISIFIAILTLLAMIIFGIIDIFKKKEDLKEKTANLRR